jgi:uracil-DNA glycosylase
MDEEVRRRFLEIVRSVRGHLEYRRALGVNAMPVATAGSKIGAAPPQLSVESRPAAAAPTAARAGHKAEALDAVLRELGACDRCKLSRGRTNIVFGEGDPEARLVFVGEGPGSEEDRQGRPFVGDAGALLTDIIVKGMKLRREDVYICNVVKCRPPGNRNPEPDEIAACAPALNAQLRAIGPSVIVTLGNVPTHTLLGTKEGITRLRGKWSEYEGVPLMPTFHPAYLLRNPRDKKLVWDDIRQVMDKLKAGAGNP